MAVPDQILGLQRIGDEGQPYWAPSTDDGTHLRLEPGENVIVESQCRVRCSAAGWTLPDNTAVVVTDRRTAFISCDFDKGGGWVGFGAAGLAISVAANAVSKHRAAKRSAGLVVIGQIRHEWIQSLELRKEKALLGPVSTYLDLTAPTAHGSVTVELWGPHLINEKMATWLVSLIVWHRSSFDGDMTLKERTELERVKSSLQDQQHGLSDGMKWFLPGNTEQLSAAAASRSPNVDPARTVSPNPDLGPVHGVANGGRDDESLPFYQARRKANVEAVGRKPYVSGEPGLVSTKLDAYLDYVSRQGPVQEPTSKDGATKHRFDRKT